MVEVHAVDRSDERRGEEDGGPGGDALDLLGLRVRSLGHRLRLEREVDAEDVLEERSERVGLVLRTDRVVLDVAQVPPLLLVDSRVVDQSREDVVERRGRALELDHLPREVVDPPGDGGAAPEDLVLDLVDVVLEPGDTGT